MGHRRWPEKSSAPTAILDPGQAIATDPAADARRWQIETLDELKSHQHSPGVAFGISQPGPRASIDISSGALIPGTLRRFWVAVLCRFHAFVRPVSGAASEP